MVARATGDPASGTVEAALAHLQPIRDLAKNWDIDIASCLQDYLNELAGHIGHAAVDSLLEEKTDGSEEPPNFAQAALLLQNSSHVYSRKVEYLHSLVYAALNEFVSSNGQKHQVNRNPSADAAVEEFNAFDPEMEFLLLDDVLPTDDTVAGIKINLADDDDEDDSLLLGNGEDRTGLFANNGDSTRLSLGGLSVTRLDRSANMQNMPSTSAASRAFMGSVFNEGPDTGGANLRLLNGRCDINESGVLLMPGSGIVGNRNGRDERKSLNMSGKHVSVNPNATSIHDGPVPMDIDHDGGVSFDNDDHNEGPGFAFAGEDEGHPPTDDVDQNEPAANPVDTNVVTKQKTDPWALLDPHDTGNSKPRPLRIGKTYRLPPGVEEPPSSYVTGASTRRVASIKLSQQQKQPSRRQNVCIATETYKVTMAAERQKRESAANSLDNSDEYNEIDDTETRSRYKNTSVPLKGLVFGNEFAYVAKAQAKLKAAERRERRKLLQKNPAAVAPEEADNLLGLDDNVDDGMDFGADDDSFGDDHSPDVDNDGGNVGNAGIVSIDDAFSTLAEGDRDVSNMDAATFEALCRAHIKAFAKGAEKYAAETNLTKRVSSWQQKLAPVLEEQEQRPEFDIQKYGDRIIHTMNEEISRSKLQLKTSNGDTPSMPSQVSVDFHSITKNCEQYEVCRLFLASLSLSNSGNMVLRHGQDGDVANSFGSLQMELLNSQVDYPMETYLAPSALEQEDMALQ